MHFKISSVKILRFLCGKKTSKISNVSLLYVLTATEVLQDRISFRCWESTEMRLQRRLGHKYPLKAKSISRSCMKKGETFKVPTCRLKHIRGHPQVSYQITDKRL